ncbi:hypothetical protein TNIN_439121 [Trichonephila inaurata madagascariensis]|uniref:Uncharacterized protein n=1 Tax=Trichonephila inaurata madagascariensis TaxID=2747483 RepID=A0A8X6XD13_9ARAC|nr:hypothetical protein TNIN_4461 [Trichonephila inaurata madagascariensis]GFY60206.1 hypothetical protein TNIN_439121 [Trichonephila inaurata madagascariensis]
MKLIHFFHLISEEENDLQFFFRIDPIESSEKSYKCIYRLTKKRKAPRTCSGSNALSESAENEERRTAPRAEGATGGKLFGKAVDWRKNL